MIRFFENKLAFAVIVGLFALALTANALQGATLPPPDRSETGPKLVALTHGPSLPPYPWENLRVAHGPSLPPYPWENLRVAHGPSLPPYPWENLRVAHGPSLPPYPWENLRAA